MVKHTSDAYDIEPPLALRPREPMTVEHRTWEIARQARRIRDRLPGQVRPPLRPVIIGATAALMFGFVADIGPWNVLLGTADAQEAPERPATASTAATPSEADRAALRYFAREGDVDRLEAELRRLRALYPGWQPPRDLLDPQGEDTDLQRLWDLVGEQRYEEARQAIAERRQRDPSWTPPARLTDILDLAATRERLYAAADARNWAEVLSIAESNERILTCEDPDSVWRVAEAFANTGRPQRAYDAYAYVIENCPQSNVRAASLQKAAAELDPSFVTRLFAIGAADETGGAEFANARLDIVRGAVARGGEIEGVDVPQEWLEVLADHARTGQNLDDAMLVGFYLYRQGNPQDAAEWFRFALDNGLGANAAEGYIVALRATNNRENEFLAREVAYQWREQTPELMEAYLDAMATVLTADESGQTSIEDVEQASVERFVPVVIQQRDANGAQALGWYAFNTCQFIIAEEWFITSANWVPTEAAIYGLALSRLRLGDQVGFAEVVDEWGDLYPAVRALATGEDLAPTAPASRARDDPTEEVGIESAACDPEQRERLRGQIVDQQLQRREPVVFIEAGSLTSIPVPALASRPRGAERPNIPRRSVVINPQPPERSSLLIPAQATVVAPPPLPAPQQARPSGTTVIVPQGNGTTVVAPGAGGAVVRPGATLPNGAPVRPVERRTTVISGADGVLDGGGTTVTRRVRTGQQTGTIDRQVTEIVGRPRSVSRRVRAAQTAGTAQQALGSRNFGQCVAITDAQIRAGTISPEEATARGYCLLELRRPFEAAQAFELARTSARFGTTVRGDAAYGATLASISANLTDEAAIAATRAPQSRARRTEMQIAILTQRAVAANNDGRYTEALYYLDQRNRIAPLQKDLMILQGYAYQNAGYRREAEQIFRAVNEAGPTPETQRAVIQTLDRKLPPPTRSTVGFSFN